MNQELIDELKSALEKEKKTLTEELGSVAHPDKKVKGDWELKHQIK